MSDIMAGDPGVEQCPRCEAPQFFAVNVADVDEEIPGIIKQTLNCKTCRWETVLRYTTREALEIEKKVVKLKQRVRFDTERHGQASATARAKLKSYQARLIRIEQEIEMLRPESRWKT